MFFADPFAAFVLVQLLAESIAGCSCLAKLRDMPMMALKQHGLCQDPALSTLLCTNLVV